jgi:hypothetical protein
MKLKLQAYMVMYECRLYVATPFWAHRDAPYSKEKRRNGGDDRNLIPILRLAIGAF